MKLSRRLTLHALLISMLFSFVACSSKSPEIPVVGETFPYTKIIMYDGTVKALNEYKGKTVVLLFWATWCGKSKRAARHINEFAKEYARRGDVVFIAANVNDIGDSDEVRTEMKESKLDYLTHAFSGNGISDEAYETLNGEGLPYIVIFDRTGRVVLTTHDYDEAFEQLRSQSPRGRR